MDLREVSPASKDVSVAVRTVHCVYSRYPCFRELRSKTAREVAEAVLDVILDIGVVPAVFQSDLGRGFVNEVMGELLQLLGAAQVFSSAVHPRSQGVTERSHQDMTALLSMSLQSLVAARPSEWGRHLRTLECRLRDKLLGKSGCTPRSVVCGWFSTTLLQSPLPLVQQIPPDLPHYEFVRGLVKGQQQLAEPWDVWKAEMAEKEPGSG